MIRRPPRSTLFPLHDALPISSTAPGTHHGLPARTCRRITSRLRSEEHTSELQSQSNLVCRLLLEKKKTHVRQLDVEDDEIRTLPEEGPDRIGTLAGGLDRMRL